MGIFYFFNPSQVQIAVRPDAEVHAICIDVRQYGQL